MGKQPKSGEKKSGETSFEEMIGSFFYNYSRSFLFSRFKFIFLVVAFFLSSAIVFVSGSSSSALRCHHSVGTKGV